MKTGAYSRVVHPTVPHYTGRLLTLPYLLKKTRLRNDLTYITSFDREESIQLHLILFQR
jgi:hypothetical protein